MNYIAGITITPDNALFHAKSDDIFFLFRHKNICFEYSLEAPCPAASNDTDNMFSWRIKENILSHDRHVIQ